jgi:vancomycin resistance protein YoaR
MVMALLLFPQKGFKRYFIKNHHLFLSLIILLLLTDYLYYQQRIYPGVYIKNIHLGQKTPREVEMILRDADLTFIGPEGRAITAALEETGIVLDYQGIFSAAHAHGRQKKWPWSYYDRLKITREGVYIPFRYWVDNRKFSQVISYLEKAFNSEAEDAYFYINSDGNEVKIIPEKNGYRIKGENLARQLEQNLSCPDIPLMIKIPYDKIPPQITALSLKEKGIVTLMSSFSTSFDPKNTDRVHNIKLAATLLDNYFLAPGEVLSLNAFFGDTTAEKGYREAPIIVGNRLMPGFGGGLCQISSTLYNAALLANLEVIERHHHQLTVPYIDPGRDATIAYNMRDLKLRNNKEHYILISPRVEDDTLTFSFFGGQMKERVEINTKILATFESPTEYQTNPELPPGKKEIIEGVPGYRVEVWKLVYEGKELKSKEKISDDNYLPYPTVIQQGP